MLLNPSCTSRSDRPAPARAQVAPNVAGLAAAGLTETTRGRILLGELGCVACHTQEQQAIDAAAGPDLASVGARLQADYLIDYLTSPHDHEPGTTMPDLMRPWNGAELHERARAIAHYLQSFAAAAGATESAATAPSSGTAPTDAAAKGAALYARIGCRACHADDQSRSYLGRKYSHASLQAFLLAPHASRPSQRMPNFALTPTEANELSHFLLGDSGPTDAATRLGTTPPTVDDDLAQRGRTHFAELRCANCHELDDPERAPAKPCRPLAELDPRAGCLSGTPGNWPHYALTTAQTAAIQAALAAGPATATGEERIAQELGSRRCFACHRRGDVDGVTARLGQDVFGTSDASLGEEGRVPPALTGVGSKLQRSWLEDSIAHGQHERPYLHVRMPGFGDRFAERIAALLDEADTLPPGGIVPLPENRKEANAVRDIGRELAGDKGMNCIACHQFAGEQAGSMGAIDLVYSTGKRLDPDWFAHFLREPFRFKPNTLMPSFFPDGKSTRPKIVDGNVQEQISALWHYLAWGRNVRKPSGLRQAAIPLAVGKERCVMLRRSVRNTGKRGISVGYAGGVNLTFDAEKLGLNQIWWGDFVDARAVWTSQGSGQAQPLSRKILTLPNGPFLARLASRTSPWPTATRRDRGDRWLGYDLDADGRPSFRYTSDGLTVNDTPSEALADGGELYLRRTLVLNGELNGERNGGGGGSTLAIRIAQGKQIEQPTGDTANLGNGFRITWKGASSELIALPDASQELRLIADLHEDTSTVEIEYHQRQK
ncbi:MAG: c-type cytochrome [Planctomycetota bacterium]